MKKRLIAVFIGFGLFCFNFALADGGMMVWPPNVYLEQTAQNAIVAWNGEEEIMILSNGVKSDEPATALRMVPLPSNPEIKGGSFESFEKLVETMNEKLDKLREDTPGFGSGKVDTEISSSAGIDIVFHEQIGSHDVTVVKVNDLDVFIDWINDFSDKNGLDKNREIKCEDFNYFDCPDNCTKNNCYMPTCPPGDSCAQVCRQVCQGGTINTPMISENFKEGISNYLKRDIKYFVFDVVETNGDEESIDPLVYRFESDYLYYPLLISGISDISESQAHIDLFFIADKNAEWPKDFGYSVEFSKEELNEVSEDLAELFEGSVEVNKVDFYEKLSDMDSDLLVFPSSYFESSDISLGIRSDEVKALQKLLINAQAWDSTADATGYFGPITRSAVIRFQEKYSQDILAPVGLKQGTGFVGSSTRAYLNLLK